MSAELIERLKERAIDAIAEWPETTHVENTLEWQAAAALESLREERDALQRELDEFDEYVEHARERKAEIEQLRDRDAPAWLVVASGEGSVDHVFTDGSDEQMRRVLCRLVINGEDQPREQPSSKPSEPMTEAEQLDAWMNDLADTDNWNDYGEFNSEVGETGHLHIMKIPAHAIRALRNDAVAPVSVDADAPEQISAARIESRKCPMCEGLGFGYWGWCDECSGAGRIKVALRDTATPSTSDSSAPNAEASDEPDEAPPTVKQLVQWLRNQYARHLELEDKLAADALERLAQPSSVDGAETGLSTGANDDSVRS